MNENEAHETTIRFIIDESRCAYFNMAADAYLLDRCADTSADTSADASAGIAGGGQVTVRLYSWTRPSITIGYMQEAGRELDLDRVKLDGLDWVKRPTGGRAVLHDGDITYSCVFPKSVTYMGSGITETYRLISMCLMNGLERASIKCGAHDSDAGIKGIGREVKLPCFLAPSRDEVMVGGRKLVGSAQKRTAYAVLQHGSIPITDAFRRLPHYLRIDRAEKEKQVRLLISKSCCADELISGATFKFLSECLMGGFSSVLPHKAELTPWSLEEEKKINEIIARR